MFIIIRLPPLVILPLANGLLNTHNIALGLIATVFIFFLYKGQKLTNRFYFLILLFFITQSLSIIKSIDVMAFINVYKNIVFGILFLIIGNSLIQKKKLRYWIALLVLSAILNCVYYLIYYLKLPYLYEVIEQITYQKYWEFAQIHALRQRYFTEMVDVSLISIIIYALIATNKKSHKVSLTILVLVILILAFLSNYRNILLVGLSSLGLGIFILSNSSLLKRTLFTGLVILGFIFSSLFISSIYENSVLNRFLLTEKYDIETITSRLIFWQKAFEMGKSSLFTGIGLNNYYDYYNPKQILDDSMFRPRNNLLEVTAMHPHNIFFGIFAETGLLGLSAIIGLLSYFVIIDINIWLMKSMESKALILALWSLFLFSLVVPKYTIQYFVLFWYLRCLVLIRQNGKKF